MDSSDEAKIFIGGIAWETTEEKLKEHFSNYGEVTQTVVMRDKITGRPRGFGFVLFSDPSVLHSVLHDTHSIDGRTVEAKRVLPREEQRTSSRPGHPNTGRSFEGTGNYKTKKIFVGGLPSTLTEEGFRQYFETYGNVTDVVIMYDQNTNRPRGFGFITFDTEDAVDRVLHKNFHELNNKLVEVKPALPKEANPGSGGGGRGGGHQPYGSSGANASTFDARMDGGQFMHPQTAGGGAYAPYPTYGGLNYGYGAANSTVGYGGYGGYGAGGYGSANIGFTGPAGAYGNPSAANAGYVSGPAGALKGPWSNQAPGYGASGYSANAGYATGIVGAVSAPMVPSPGGASGYASQGYGYYSNYGGSEGSYTNSGGGAPNSNSGGNNTAGGHQGTGGSYTAYSNASWRSDS
ncbi:hypothetical protein ACSBR1_021467 [Camellia fascicularis]